MRRIRQYVLTDRKDDIIKDLKKCEDPMATHRLNGTARYFLSTKCYGIVSGRYFKVAATLCQKEAD